MIVPRIPTALALLATPVLAVTALLHVVPAAAAPVASVHAAAHAAPALSELALTEQGRSASGPAPVMVVLDASGSMRAADAPGSRIAAAKRAVDGLVDTLPAGAPVGLEVYGTSTGSAPSDRAAGCRDIKVLVPVGPVDRPSFRARVAGIRASGYTPIGESLRRAAAALPAEGPRSIVLVSDGEDTCAPPQPCAVARSLHARGVDLTVHTVGFKVDAAARSQLQCIAHATGGSYRDAEDGPSLSDELGRQVQRALRGYTTAGTPITGGRNANDAVPLEPGQYVDRYADAASAAASSDGTAKTYLVRLRDGETPYFSATVVPPPRRVSSATLQVNVSVSPLDDDSFCTETGYGYDIGIGVNKVTASTATVAPGRVGSAKTCLTAGPAVVTVTRGGTAFPDEPLPVELAYRVEAPADATGLQPPADERANARADVTAAARPIDSGSSFNDAPEVGSGVYHDIFTSGETRFVKVHLDWGQRLAYSFAFTRLPHLGVLDGVAGYSSLANPVRQKLAQPTGARTGTAFIGTDTNATGSLFGSTVAPLRYTNRDSTDTDVVPLSISGDYYIALSTAFTSTGDPAITVPYTLKVEVTGTPERGPVHQRLGGTVPSTGSSASTGSASTGSTGSSGSATSTSRSSGSVATPQPSSSPVADSSDGGVSTPVVAAGAGGVTLLVLGALGALVLRRRPGTSAQHGPMNVWPGDLPRDENGHR